MAPPSGQAKIEIRTWQWGNDHYACQHGWFHPGIELPVRASSGPEVVQKLRVMLECQMRAYVEREFPYYVQELLASTIVEIHPIDPPCPLHRDHCGR